MFLTVRPFTINGELVDPAEVDKPRPHSHYLADGRRIYTQEGTRRPPVINHWFRETLFGEVVLVGVVNGHRIILPIMWVAGVPTGDGSVAQFIGCNDGSAKGTASPSSRAVAAMPMERSCRRRRRPHTWS